MIKTSLKLSTLAVALCSLTRFDASAQFLPADAGTTVNGFQDNFTNTVRDPAWKVVNPSGEDVYEQINGVLRVFAPTNSENPNHLIYEPDGLTYDGAVQEVLARIRVTDYQFVAAASDDQLAGIALSCQNEATNTPYGGYCFMLANLDGANDLGDPFFTRVVGPQVRALDDYQAWGPGASFSWTINQWYWMRMSSDGITIKGKIWPGDGSVAEPADYQVSWDQGGGRSGFAGITGAHVGPMEFEVDYFLVKATGLPSITVTPQLAGFYLTAQPQDVTVAVGGTVSFSVTATSSSAVTYQWQSAPAGSSTFADIAGATSASYTTPSLASADNGSQYRAVVNSGGSTDESRVATVTIDSTAPTLAYAKTLGSATHVTLQFSEPVRVPANANGFTSAGLTFSGVAQGAQTSQLVLTCSAMTLGMAYTLAVSHVADLAGNPMAVANLAIDQSLRMPVEFGTTVNGFQDDFSGASLNPDWVASPNDPAVLAQFTQANGVLNFTTAPTVAGNDPEHLLYQPVSGYDSTNQEVLARVRLNSAAVPDSGIRFGPSTMCDLNATPPGQGASIVFYDYSTIGIYARTLVDGQFIVTIRQNGNRIFATPGEWFWMRAQCTQGTNILTKVWPADGITPEPANFQGINTFTPGTSSMLYAGIQAASGGAPVNFDVDYFLLKASGLPSVHLTAPEALSFGPFITFTQQPIATTVVPPGTPVTLTVGANGSAPPGYQWQKAAPGSPSFANIAAQTGTSLTVSLSEAEAGTQFRCMVSVPGLSLPSATATIITVAGPPTLLSAKPLGIPTQLVLTFNRAVVVPTDASGFSVNNGVTASAVGAGSSVNTLVLTTSPLSMGTTYTLTATGVQDTFSNAMGTVQITVDFSVEVPAEYGQSVAGFQDDFTGSTADPNWTPVGLTIDNGTNIFQQTGNGRLHVLTPPTDFTSNPNHLLYTLPGYNDTNQEVLIRMRVNNFAPAGGGDLDSIGGAALACSTLSTHGGSGGIDWLLVNPNDAANQYTPFPGPQAVFLNDWAAWGGDGAAVQFDWHTNVWYWLRVLQTGSNSVSRPNIFGKVWLADGSTPEPAAWQASWSQGGRAGFAGIDAASYFVGDATTIAYDFDVDYFLLKASGLPNVTVNPGTFSLVPPRSPLTFTGAQSAPNGLVVEWTGAGTLQQAKAITGPWTDLVDPAGAESPYTFSTTNSPAVFLRLRQ